MSTHPLSASQINRFQDAHEAELKREARAEGRREALQAIQARIDESKVYPDEDFSLGCMRGLVHAKTAVEELIP